MYRGAEVKVGLIALLGLALVAVFTFYLIGLRPGAAAYPVCVVFDNAQGLVSGDPVRMAGVQIGEVKSVELDPNSLKAKVYLEIYRGTTLYSSYRFLISSGGLIQERFVEVTPTAPSERRGVSLAYGACVKGSSAPGLSELIATGAEVLQNLNRTSELLRTTLSDKEIMGRVKRALDSLAGAADAASALVNSTLQLTEQTQPQVQATLNNVASASKEVRLALTDLRSITVELRQRVEKGEALDNLEAITASARNTSEHLERITADVAKLTGDAQIQGDLRATVADIHDSAAALKRITGDVEAASKEVRKAAPTIPTVASEVGKIAETSRQLRERLKPPEIHPRFDVLYSPESDRLYSAANLDLFTPDSRFLRLGVDDIGEANTVNAQVGRPTRRGALRYGLVRSQLGVGLDLRLGRRGLLSVDVFDPNNLRGDVLASLPAILGNDDLSLVLGVRDVGEGSLFVTGARLRQ